MLPSPLNRLTAIHRHFTMNAQELENFLADSPPTTVNLVIKKHFEALDDQQKRYAHYISK
jgi:dipeptidyl-peptidase-3